MKQGFGSLDEAILLLHMEGATHMTTTTINRGVAVVIQQI